MQKREKIAIVLILLIGIILYTGYVLHEQMVTVSVHKSPDSKFELIIQKESLINDFIPTAPGNGGISNKPVIAILKYRGRTIDKSEDIFLYMSLDVKWDIENKKVYYTRIDYFKLN